ncbi:hypothetical protein EON81_02930 [bacterium]|nr:MAG: hypothetical protein EON81_02930 [bacterium]
MDLAPHIAIRVCDGGYLVQHWTKERDGSWRDREAVFASKKTALKAIGRFLDELEGPDWDDFQKSNRLGPLRLPTED